MKQLNLNDILDSYLSGSKFQIPPYIRKIIYNFLEKILKVKEINKVLDKNYHLINFDFINQFFEDINFSYLIKSNQIKNIPQEGRVFIISNHPLGGIDGMALLSAVGEVRKDVKVIVNDLLMEIENLQDLFIPTAVFSKKISKERIQKILEAIQNDECVIIFPAGEVSRLKWSGIKDNEWAKSFISLSKKYHVPILPTYVEGRNSILFYLVAKLKHMFGTALLPHEMFRKSNKTIKIHFGKLIPSSELYRKEEEEAKIIHNLRNIVYNLKKGNLSIYKSEEPIISHTEKELILSDLKNAEILSTTKDGKIIYLCKYENSLNLLREIGRLREITFRSVGEGTGKRIDLDNYDRIYYHIVLWDEEAQEIIGSYRIGDSKIIINKYGLNGLYTHTLFDYNDEFHPILNQAIELGRSFIQEKYWGSASLGYLWSGIVAYLNKNMNIRYLFGPVSISNDYPKEIKELIVYYYQKWYHSKEKFVHPKNPYKIDVASKLKLQEFFDTKNYQEDFRKLKFFLKERGHTIPILFRRYVELCDYGGATFSDFNVDPEFSDCIDGFLILETEKISKESRERYNYTALT